MEYFLTPSLSFFHREGNVVAFFRNLLGVPMLSKEVLRQRTDDYNRWVEAFARKQKIPLIWAVPGERKEDRVRPSLERRRARPVQRGKTKIAGIKLEHTRLLRLMEVLLRRAGGGLGGWTVTELRAAVLDAFSLSPPHYSLNAVRYDLRKLRAHGLLERLPHSYRYQVTLKGQKAATLMTLLRKRIYGPISASAFHHRPASDLQPNSRFERAYAKVDKTMEDLILSLAA
jgi:hypothetical protein